jgi:hypothetical protein
MPLSEFCLCSVPHSQEPATCPRPEPDNGLPFHFFNIHFNIIFPSAPVFSKWSLSLRYPNQNYVSIYVVLLICHKPRQYSNIRIIFEETCKSWSSLLCSFLQSCILGHNVVLSHLSSNIFSLCTFLRMRDQVSHPHKTGRKIVILKIVMFIFLDRKLEEKGFWTEW